MSVALNFPNYNDVSNGASAAASGTGDANDTTAAPVAAPVSLAAQAVQVSASQTAASSAVGAIASGSTENTVRKGTSSYVADTSSGAPNLPFAEGANDKEASTAVALLPTSFNEIAAYQVMMDASQKSYNIDAKLNNSSNLLLVSAKQLGVAELKKQIKGEQQSAVTHMVGAIAGSALTIGAAGWGVKGMQANGAAKTAGERQNLDKLVDSSAPKPHSPLDANASPTDPAKPHTSAGEHGSTNKSQPQTFDEEDSNFDLPPATVEKAAKATKENISAGATGGSHLSATMSSAAAQGLGTLTTSVFDAGNKLAGGEHQSDMAKIAQKQLDVQTAALQGEVDATKAAKDKASKGADDGIAALKQHYDLVKSTNDNITGR